MNPAPVLVKLLWLLMKNFLQRVLIFNLKEKVEDLCITICKVNTLFFFYLTGAAIFVTLYTPSETPSYY